MPVPYEKTAIDLFTMPQTSNPFAGNDFYHYWNGGIPETLTVYNAEEPVNTEPDTEMVELKNNSQ